MMMPDLIVITGKRRDQFGNIDTNKTPIRTRMPAQFHPQPPLTTIMQTLRVLFLFGAFLFCFTMVLAGFL
jgi:hypothetical protein